MYSNATYVDDTDTRPSCLFDRLIMLLVVSNSVVVILDGFLRIPSTILYEGIQHVTSTRESSQELTSGEEILTLLMFARIISSLSHKDSDRKTMCE